MAPYVQDSLETPSSKLVNPIAPQHVNNMDPEFVAYYNRTIGLKKATHQVDIESVRSNPATFNSPWCEDTSKEQGVRDVRIASVDGFEFAARVYSPDASKFGAGPYPVHVNYHGGGFIFGDLSSDATFCKIVCERIGIVVVDVNYRLCPEHRYGKNIEDAWSALQYIHSHPEEFNIRANSISIGGISAGALFSEVLQHLARDAGLPLKLAVLAVPPADYHSDYKKPTDSRFKSFTTMAEAPCLNWARISYFQKYVYTSETRPFIEKELTQWWRSPLLAPNFANLCDTFVITAEFDPIRDEGEAYGHKLVAAGNKVMFKRYLGVPHPFMHMLEIKKARDYNDDVCASLSEAHGLSKSIVVR